MHGRYHGAAIWLALCSMLSVGAACSKESDTGGERQKVAFVVPMIGPDSFAGEMAAGFRAGVKQVGDVDAVVEGPPHVDGQRQLEIFQNLANTTKSGISVFTLQPDLLAQPMAEAAQSGIPLIAVDVPPPPNSNIKLFISNDNYQLGQQLADEVIAKLPADAKGKIVLGTPQPGVPVLDQRASGMRDQIRKKLPDVSVVGPFDSRGEPGLNLDAWKTLVKANPKALAFMGTGEHDGYNLASIRKETDAKWLAAGFDLNPKALEAVKEDNLLLVSPEHFVKGALAGRLQAKRAKDDAPLPEGWLYTPGLAINRTNIDAIVTRQSSDGAKEAYFGPEIDKILADKSYLRPMNPAG